MSATERLKRLQRSLSSRVMGKSGVTGTAIGERGGSPCLKVYLSDASAAEHVPDEVEGVPVVTEVTGTIRPR